MQQWEYYFLVRENNKFFINGKESQTGGSIWKPPYPFVEMVNALGKEGWEMVSFQYGNEINFSMAFKRPKVG